MKLFSIFINHPTERFRSSHSSTVCELKNGDFFAVWFSGSIEGAPDTVILGSRFSVSEQVWSEPQVIVDVPDYASGNARVFTGPRDELWLLFAVNYGAWCHGGSRLFLKRSFDEGVSWSDMRIFWDQWGILGKNKPLHLRLDPSVWLIPVEWEDECVSAFFRSDDYGSTWTLTEKLGKKANVRVEQPTVVELGKRGSLMAYMRSCEGFIYRSYSDDAGKSWSEPAPTTLPNNDSGIDMVRLRGGMLLLVHNPVALGEDGTSIVDQSVKKRPELKISQSEFSKDKQFYRTTVPDIELVFPRRGPRTPLIISCSMDNGETWEPWINLETGQGEFSYPAVIESSNGDVHLTYTYNRTYIKHVIVPLEIVKNKQSQFD